MLVIVDYEAGNLRSVQRACTRVGLESVISADPEVLLKADRAIFPGVGAATSAVDTLEQTGLGDALLSFYESGRPLLGICLGAQIILEFTEEDKRHCLGMIEGVCEQFVPEDRTLKVPHMGWNEVQIVQDHPLLEGIESGSEFYFVHSYYPHPTDPKRVFCTTDYGSTFCSALGKDNLFATQFHLEKSGEIGLQVLQNFGTWNGKV